MRWFSVLEWTTWLVLILVYSKPVIWCCILETVLELEICNRVLSASAIHLFLLIFQQRPACVKSLAGVVGEFYVHSGFLVSSPNHFRWAAFVEYHPFAEWGCPRVSGSRAEISQVPMICQPSTSAAVSLHSTSHHLEKLSVRPSDVFSAEWVWFQTVNRCLVAFVWMGKVRGHSVRVKRRSGLE